MSRTLLICRTLHQDKYSFQVFASWVLNVYFIEILQTCSKQSLHSIWMSLTTYLNSYLQFWHPVHFWRPALVLRYNLCFDLYWNYSLQSLLLFPAKSHAVRLCLENSTFNLKLKGITLGSKINVYFSYSCTHWKYRLVTGR